MNLVEYASGQKSSWNLFKKLGEGDAGEVFLVESLLEKKYAILKRPHRSAFSSDTIRQASQIESEGKILRALEGVRIDGTGFSLITPALLDQSQPGTEFSNSFFIVIEKAQGFDLNSLARAARFGQIDQELNHQGVERIFLERLASRGTVPDLILLRALQGVIELLEKIHGYRVSANGLDQSGIIWNDVKPEHIHWDPARRRFMVIDWGNGQFLEEDGATKDRRFSRLDDYAQFAQQMGKFLADTTPELYAKLEWPANVILINSYPEAVKTLGERVTELLFEEFEKARDARQEEEILVNSVAPILEYLQQLGGIQEQTLDAGEYPDYAASEKLYSRLAARLATENRLEDFRQLCSQAAQIPEGNGELVRKEKWNILGQLSDIAAQSGASPHQPLLLHSLVSGASEDWAAVLWDLTSIVQDRQPPSWWDELTGRMRRLQIGNGMDELTPYVTVSRTSYTLQAALVRLEEEDAEKRQTYENLVRELREEVVKKWDQIEPDPPDSSLEYQDIDRVMQGLNGSRNGIFPESQQVLERALDQPKAQVKIILDAWGRKDFETARRGLRQLLLWDPERKRVLTADRAIQSAPGWLEKVYLGPRKEEPLPDFMMQAELAGRELRNQVGSARWLDLILEAFARLRKGASPSELIAEHPELLNEIFWLNDYEARRPAPPPRTEPVRLEREQDGPAPEAFLTGIREGALSEEGEMLLGDSLDTWVPEARGSSARVFQGFMRTKTGGLRQGAVKLIRPDRFDYALPLFREEIQILTLMREVPGVNGLMELGYIHLEDGLSLPGDERHASARGLSGSVLRFGVNEVRDFLASLDQRTKQGWLPYLALEKRDPADNLMTLCDAGYTHGRFLPVDESLRLAIQICDILHAAHTRNIVYRDHKILHYYWLEIYNGVSVIDWNVAKRYPQGLSNAEIQFDLVQFGARALHHIMTGRPAPGALPLGPTRPDEIEHAARTYSVRWNYDDKRLPAQVKDILEGVLAGEYTSVKALRDDLHGCFMKVTND